MFGQWNERGGKIRFVDRTHREKLAESAIAGETPQIGVFVMSEKVTSPPESPAQLLDVARVAALLDCSPRHVYRLADAGRMPRPRHVGALVRWQKSEIEAWVADGCPAVRTVPKGGTR